jgi:hypothetical protein
MIEPGQLCRDRTCETFKVAIVLGPSRRGGKFRVCRWQSGYPDGRWSAPRALFEHELEPLTADFDLTTRHGQVVAAARRSIIGGLVRWNVGGFGGLTEVHVVGAVRP